MYKVLGHSLYTRSTVMIVPLPRGGFAVTAAMPEREVDVLGSVDAAREAEAYLQKSPKHLSAGATAGTPSKGPGGIDYRGDNPEVGLGRFWLLAVGWRKHTRVPRAFALFFSPSIDMMHTPLTPQRLF